MFGWRIFHTLFELVSYIREKKFDPSAKIN